MIKSSFKITSNAKSLSSFSGLFLYSDLISKFEFKNLFGAYLPKLARVRGFTSFGKFYSVILGFVAGAECIDDFDSLGNDPLFYKMTHSPSAITIGKFLRSFNLRQIEQIKNQLPIVAFKIRMWLQPNLYKIIFKMDGTLHQQYGYKMEGVEFNYKKFRSLSSQNLYDDKGLCYGFELRDGATHSSVGAVEMLENTFKVIPKSIQKYFVADAAYATTDIYNTLINHHTHFAICLPELVWGSLLKNYGNKMTWIKTKMNFFQSEKCEIGEILYPKKGLSMGKTFLRVVFIRAKKKKIEAGDHHPYDYYAVVTNINHDEMNGEKIIKFYRKRANVENFIKDIKNGMDFHHFPCQSLKANKVWGCLGVLAYNLMRLTSFIIYPRTGCFLKTTRRKIVAFAGEIILHARSIELKIMDFLSKEVQRLRMILSGSFFKAENAGFIPLLE
jgi:hypothetical protein